MIRRVVENAAWARQQFFWVPSFSSRTLVYGGMLIPHHRWHLRELSTLSETELIADRYEKFRAMGVFTGR